MTTEEGTGAAVDPANPPAGGNDNVQPATQSSEPGTQVTSTTATTTQPAGDEKAANANAATESGEQPIDWAAIRTKIAGGDEKVLNRLSRYGTLEEAIKSGLEARSKLDGLRPTQALTAESTPEEIAAYRKANGVPETAEGYEISLPDGLVLGEQDKPIADAFKEIAHKHNLKPDLVNEIVGWNLKMQEQMMNDLNAADTAMSNETTARLKSNDGWGSEYEKNTNTITALLNQGPPGMKEQLFGARLADGSLLGNNLDALRFLDSVARKVLPLATVTPTYGQTQLETARAELASLQKEMGDHNGPYWKGAQAAGKQARALELNEMLLTAGSNK